MRINRQDMDEACQALQLPAHTSAALWQKLQERQLNRAHFSFTHILYYFGGLMAIFAMTLFMTLGWESFGGWGICLLALLYIAGGLALAHYLLQHKRLPIPAGILATLAICLVPLAVFGAQMALGYWQEDTHYRDYHRLVDWRWLGMELTTLAAAAIALWWFRLPFMMMPVAVTLWYLSMDLTPWLLQLEDAGNWELHWELRRWVSLYMGLLILLLALWIDLRNRSQQDFSFWLYLFGLLAFWGALSSMESDSQLSKFIYFCLNVGLILFGALVVRRLFVVFGGLGSFGYLAYLAYDVFANSTLFPFILSGLGLGLVYLGVQWQRHEVALRQRLVSLLPANLANQLEALQLKRH
ncbi:hypothetical protein [Balneatrix alpica]|uniref:DUF2157 domain-containing protein n=1 Tax=Balneatrix alpica TaxID=75684 RepID=A0ABV5ZEN7_9GAMM|nr:hypothetical protein [Balneatrix alpica]